MKIRHAYIVVAVIGADIKEWVEDGAYAEADILEV